MCSVDSGPGLPITAVLEKFSQYRIYWRGVHENDVKRARELTFKEGTVRWLWPKLGFRQAKRILAESSGKLVSYWMRQWSRVRLTGEAEWGYDQVWASQGKLDEAVTRCEAHRRSSSGGSCLPEAESLWELSLEKALLGLHGKPQTNPIITQNILGKGQPILSSLSRQWMTDIDSNV